MSARLVHAFGFTLWITLTLLSASSWVQKDWRMAAFYSAMTIAAIFTTVKSAYSIAMPAPYPHQSISQDEPIFIVLLCAVLSFLVGFWGSIIIKNLPRECRFTFRSREALRGYFYWFSK